MRGGLFLSLAIGALAAGIMPTAAEVAHLEHGGQDARPSRRSKSKGKGIRRGKGAISRPKRRPNRALISKRVRRKHRRQRAA